jgi:hypothetical protein
MNRRQADLPTYLCFIDYYKAYDCSARDRVMGSLATKGITGKLHKMIASLINNNQKRAKTAYGYTTPVSSKFGLLQGGKMSPILFNILIDEVLERIQKEKLGVLLSSGAAYHLPAIGYADDIVLIAPSRGNLQKMLSLIEEESLNRHLMLNVTKCGTMSFETTQVVQHALVTSEGEPIQEVDSYKYLGVPINTALDWKEYVKLRVQKARSALALLVHKGGHLHGMPLETSVKLYRSLVLPILQANLEVIPLNDHQKSQLEQVTTKFSRRLLNCPQRIPAIFLRRELGIPSIACLAEMAQLRFFVHLYQPGSDAVRATVRQGREGLLSPQFPLGQVANTLVRNQQQKTWLADMAPSGKWLARTKRLVFLNWLQRDRHHLGTLSSMYTYLYLKPTVNGTQAYLSENGNSEGARIRALLRAGSLGCATVLHAWNMRPTNNCPFCPRLTPQTPEHLFWTCPTSLTERWTLVRAIAEIIPTSSNIEGITRIICKFWWGILLGENPLELNFIAFARTLRLTSAYLIRRWNASRTV